MDVNKRLEENILDTRRCQSVYVWKKYVGNFVIWGISVYIKE